MNHRGRWRIGVLASAVALLGSLASLEAHALSLGRITVQSALGEPLRGEIEITDINPEEASSLDVGLASAETFKAAGLEYPSAATSLQIKLQRRANGKPYLRLNSTRAITEPFVDLILEARWSSGRITKDYSMLFDPPAVRAGGTALAMTAPVLAPAQASEPAVETASNPTEKPQAVAAAPVADAAQPAPEAVAKTDERVPAPVAQAAQPLPEVKSGADEPAAAPAPRAVRSDKPKAAKAVPLQETPDGASQVTVKAGDTANKIAARTKPSSVSLDQMLVALLRSNPNAFIGGNINMVKSGAVLEIPSEEAASATSSSEARQVIVAQSKDFNAFRRKLAETVAATSVASPDRQADGKLQANVEDSAETSAAQDKLRLSKSVIQGKPTTTPEDKIIKEKEAQDSATRVTEMTKNIDELKKLGATSTAAGPASAPSGVPAIAMPGPSASTPAEAQAASSAAAPSSAPQPSASAAADSAAQAASAPASDASAPAALASASEPASAASDAAAPASAPAKKPALVAAPEPEPELMDELLENAVPVLGGVGVLGLLGGLAVFMRRRQKNKKGANPLVDSTFLESRLQPDSFFGASGGNRVNTNDNNAPGSSMAYTPSQMDASGDVDPVAEADVYLAYGRDEQAEDILKEALHAYPARVAIHAKLLEIYKTRRDIKTFESVAAEAFRLTQGQGPEWAYIVELGSELDPANPLYRSVQPEPAPEPDNHHHDSISAAVSPVAAPSMSAPPAASTASVDVDMDFSLDEAPQIPAAPVAVSAPQPSAAPPQVSSPATASAPASTLGDLDLGLDFDLAPTPSPAPTPPAAAAQAAPPTVDLLSNELEFDPVPPPPKPSAAPASAAPAPHAEGMMEFDLDAFALDIGAPAAAAPAAAPAAPQEEDPLEIKFLLAEEFHSLGDTDGARALADEVLAKAKGPLKTKVQAFLNALS